MTYFASSDSVSYLAAQLALLVLRAGVSRELPLAGDRVILAPSPTSISAEEATQQLAALPKPLVCRAYPVNGVLTVSCATLPEHDHHWYRLTREEAAKRGSYLWYLDERYGKSSAHPVLVFGREDETLLVPSSAVDAWHRDYEIRGVDSVADDAGNSRAAANPAYREAKRRGAHGLLRFSSPTDSEGRISVVTFPSSKPRVHDEPEPSEDYLIELAHHLYQRLLLERMAGSSRPRALSTRTPQLDDSGEYRGHVRQLTVKMRRYYATRPMPRLIAAFLEECNQLPWCRPQN